MPTSNVRNVVAMGDRYDGKMWSGAACKCRDFRRLTWPRRWRGRTGAGAALDAALLRPPSRPAPGGGFVPSPSPAADGVVVDARAKAVFDSSWRRLVTRLGGVQNLQARTCGLPGFSGLGAPGSGKSTNAAFILRLRGLSRSLCVSELLLGDAAAAARAARGELVPDAAVADALFGGLLDPGQGATAGGVLVDGFPRTPLQVDLLVLLSERLRELHARWAASAHPLLARRFPRPAVRLVVLWVDEEVSVRRQLARGAAAQLLQQQLALGAAASPPAAAAAAAPPAAGPAPPLRPTDASEPAARARYAVFRRHFDTLLRLRVRFPFALVDACGPLAVTEALIRAEVASQAALELGGGAYDALRGLPTAAALAASARADLVARLDGAAAAAAAAAASPGAGEEEALLPAVVAVAAGAGARPALAAAALCGRALLRATDPALARPGACALLADVLAERGFACVHLSSGRPAAAGGGCGGGDAAGAASPPPAAEHVFLIEVENALLRTAGRPAAMAAAAAVASGGGGGGGGAAAAAPAAPLAAAAGFGGGGFGAQLAPAFQGAALAQALQPGGGGGGGGGEDDDDGGAQSHDLVMEILARQRRSLAQPQPQPQYSPAWLGGEGGDDAAAAPGAPPAPVAPRPRRARLGAADPDEDPSHIDYYH